MSPVAKAVAYGIVSLAAFALFFWGLYAAMTRTPSGQHASTAPPRDGHAPTLGDALAALAAALWHRAVLHAALTASDIAHWHPVRRGRLRWWARQYRRELRAAAAAAAPEGTSPAPQAHPAPGEVPLNVRATASDGMPAVAFTGTYDGVLLNAREYLP